MKHLTLIALFFLTLFTACGQVEENEIEAILFDCLIESYNQQGVDLQLELDSLESYLIENESLTSSSGQSYSDFYQQIVELDDIPATLDYDKFENIYAINPSQYYSTDCLEKLNTIDSTELANSKHIRMHLAIEKASVNGVSPSAIASAITGVLGPTDFDHPYYRATALLTIAHTCTGTDNLKQLEQPIPGKDASTAVKMTVFVTENTLLVVGTDTVDKEKLHKVLYEFIEVNTHHTIQLEAESGTHYDFYVEVQDLLARVYMALRNDLAMASYDKSFSELPTERQEEIRAFYPTSIVEVVR